MCVHLFARDESEYLFADKRGPWAGSELTLGLSYATARHLGVRLPVSQWRHVGIAVGNRFLHKGVNSFRDQELKVEAADGDDNNDDCDLEDEEEITTMAEVQVRQSGHGSRVARAHMLSMVPS